MQGLTGNEQTTLQIMKWQFQGIEDGCKKFVAYPDKHFWDLWRTRKDYLKVNGISVSKVADTYVVTKYENQSNVGQKFKGKPIKSVMYPDLLKGKQKEHVITLCNALIRQGAALDASITGAGKTYCARAVAKELGVEVLIVCPFTALSMWRRVTAEIGVQAEVINYEKLRTFKTPYLRKLDVEKKSKSKHDNSELLEWLITKDKLIVFDESHRLRNYKTISSDMLLAATKQGYDTLLLSATLADSPLNMQITGFALRLFSTLSGYWPWAFQHGVKKQKDNYGNTLFVFDENNPQHLKNINAQIFPEHGSRLTKLDLPELFKETFITAEAYDMKSASQIQDYYDEMSKTPGDYMRLRREIELCKIDTFVQLAKDALEEGNSVAIFVNFRDTLFQLAEILETDCVIFGDQNGSKKGLQDRENNNRRFQENTSRVIICTTQSGSEVISLHDLTGDYPRVSLISPTPDSTALKQVFGRIDRAMSESNSVQKIIYAAGTVEEDVAYRVRKKLKNLSLLNDGDVTESFEMVEGVQ